MSIRIGNAPCSWGVEFAHDPRNPDWRRVLRENAQAGYSGIELGPIGYMPEDPPVLADALAEQGQELIGGVVFRAFHDPSQWQELLDAATRTCKALNAHGARHLVLIDSIAERRAKTAGRAHAAQQMSPAEWQGFSERIATVAKMGCEEYGLTVSIHAHAGGFMDFEAELVRLLDAVDERILKICLDTGHQTYAGFDILAFMRRHMDRIGYIHFKDIDPAVKADVIEKQTDFYAACGQGIFCKLGDGVVDFPALRQLLLDYGFDGWCTVEQDCDPTLPGADPLADARANRHFLSSIGF